MKPGLLTLKNEHKLKTFEKKVLRKMFTPKRDDISREWRKPRNSIQCMYLITHKYGGLDMRLV